MKYLYYLLNYILSFFYDIYYFFFGDVRSRIQGLNYYKESKKYPDYLKFGNMSEVVRGLTDKYCQGNGLDIGAGKWPIKNSRAIENNINENAYKIIEEDGSQDFIFSSHSLEHLNEWEKALDEWHRVLRSGGILFLYIPHEICSMWRVGVNKQHIWAPSTLVVESFLKNKLNMNIEKVTYLPDSFLGFLIIAKK